MLTSVGLDLCSASAWKTPICSICSIHAQASAWYSRPLRVLSLMTTGVKPSIYPTPFPVSRAGLSTAATLFLYLSLGCFFHLGVPFHPSHLCHQGLLPGARLVPGYFPQSLSSYTSYTDSIQNNTKAQQQSPQLSIDTCALM